MKYPSPGTEAFNKLGPNARTIARAAHNSESLTDREKPATQTTLKEA